MAKKKAQQPSQARTAQPFGIVLKRFRNERGMSQEQVAADAGLSLVYVNMLERGKRHPSLDTVFAIADALSVDVSHFVEAVAQELHR